MSFHPRTPVRVGHWTDPRARTGCTVVLLPEPNVSSGEVRGGAPGTREFALLDPTRLVAQVDAVVLAGGSAFGLAACDGVAAWLEEQGRGFPTVAGRVPIVVGMVLFDLMVGDPTVRPGPDEGRAACETASVGPWELGAVGAGTGLTFGKWHGRELAREGGLGAAREVDGELEVIALVAVNAVGDRLDPTVPPSERPPPAPAASPASSFTNTTVGVVVTNAALDKVGAHLVAQSAHDGLARAIEPSHTLGDGDAFVACAAGPVSAPLESVRLLAARAVETAIRSVASR
ncbi:MAG TPA: P1 family peptidase [Acidimicrobiales bacterium]|nr:P1 family peptidase [Acidimicrobiales bacterium]